jgi:intracellular septation protein
MSAEPKSQSFPLSRLALDFGPLVLFFAAFQFLGIYWATGVFMAAVLVALGIGYMREGRVPPMPLFTAVLVLVFGGLTLYLHSAVFLKMKPTVLYALFGVLLLGGLAFDRLHIKSVFAQAIELTDLGWRKLTFRYGIFFLALAVLNEIVWRNFSTSIWVYFKVFGIIPLILLFTLSQMPLMMKHQVEDEKNSDSESKI